MLLFALVLGVMAYGFEILVGSIFKPLRFLAQRSILINLLLSLGFTSFLAVLFGATGLTVMTAALVSALLSIITYRLWRE